MSRAFSSCASFNIFSISSIFSASIPLALWNTKLQSKSPSTILRGEFTMRVWTKTARHLNTSCATVQWIHPSVISLVNDGIETSSTETGGLRNISSYMKIQLDRTYSTSMKICLETLNEAHVDYKYRKRKCVVDYSREEAQTSLKLYKDKCKQTAWEHFK